MPSRKVPVVPLKDANKNYCRPMVQKCEAGLSSVTSGGLLIGHSPRSKAGTAGWKRFSWQPGHCKGDTLSAVAVCALIDGKKWRT
jgi:hypothetical protein